MLVSLEIYTDSCLCGKKLYPVEITRNGSFIDHTATYDNNRLESVNRYDRGSLGFELET